MQTFIYAIATMALAGCSMGHVSMITPCARYTPFGKDCPQPPSGESLDYSINGPIGTHEYIAQPLCKYTTSYEKPTAQWTAGQSVTVEFNPNAAVHGGGHCQFALSYDSGKSFVVIHDELKYCLTGGPSSGNSAGKLSYSIPLPSDLPSGDKVIFAWAWNNAIGNREFYMNCADVSIKGSGSSFTGPELITPNYGPNSPFIPEFNGNYDTGLDLFKSRKEITVSGSGYSESVSEVTGLPDSGSYSSVPSAPIDVPDTSSAGMDSAGSPSGTGTPDAGVPNAGTEVMSNGQYGGGVPITDGAGSPEVSAPGAGSDNGTGSTAGNNEHYDNGIPTVSSTGSPEASVPGAGPPGLGTSDVGANTGPVPDINANAGAGAPGANDGSEGQYAGAGTPTSLPGDGLPPPAPTPVPGAPAGDAYPVQPVSSAPARYARVAAIPTGAPGNMYSLHKTPSYSIAPMHHETSKCEY